MRPTIFLALIALGAAASACERRAVEAPSPQPARDAWTPHQHVLSMLPLIDACLARSPATRTVVIDPQAAEFMRLSGAEQTVDCVFPHDAVRAENASIVPERPNIAIAYPVVFVRAPGENPGGECYEAPEVRDDNGALLGWLLDPEGC